MKTRLIIVGLSLFGVVLLSSQSTMGKSPAWQPGEHPRLVATAAERTALQQKLTAPNTVSGAIWSSFLASNRASDTSGASYNDGDAGVLYFVTGSATAGQQAHDFVMDYLAVNPTPITPSLTSFDVRFWRYRSFLLTYDLAYDRFTSAEHQQIRDYIAWQGVVCQNSGPSWAPGNIAGTWASCLLGSAILLEGENYSTTVIDEPVVHGQLNGRDNLKYPQNVSAVTIRDSAGGSVAYTNPADYGTCQSAVALGRCIDWAAAGAEPAAGATYYVSYTFTPQTEHWQTEARKFIDYHLNYQWHDGYYNGGVHPYLGAAVDDLLFLLEMSKRSLGLDYRGNDDLKRAIDQFIYERLPADDGRPYRYNMINDTSNWTEAGAWDHPESAGFRSWIRPLVAWGTSAYAGDAEGYDQRYAWFWQKVYRNGNGAIRTGSLGASWREAWWINDQVVGSYPVTTLATPDIPHGRYFRGREVVYNHPQGLWSGNQNAAALSFVAGPHNYQNEHDQGDSGSFTFHVQGEDWAVDQGYGNGGVNSSGYTSIDHNTVGIDDAGYYAAGSTYGDDVTTPHLGGSTNIDHVALTDGATAISADLSKAWSMTEVSPVARQGRYLAMVGGGHPEYLVIGDDVEKDGANHSYQWYLHTAPGNAVSTNGQTQTITGTSATAKVITLSPANTTSTWSDVNNGNLGNHKRLNVSVSGVVNPNFLNLVMPTPPGSPAPIVSRTDLANGTAATVTWANGDTDIILWRHSGSSISWNGIISDAKLTVVRVANGQATGLVVMAGRSVTYGLSNLLTTYDGTAPLTITAFGSTAAIDSPDASLVAVRIPTITAAVIQDGGGNVEVTNDGSVAHLNAAEPFRRVRAGAPILRQEDFSDNYADDFLIYNMESNPVADQRVVNGVFQLKPTVWDWLGVVRRDNTPRRRSWFYPTVIPPVYHDDAVFNFKFRFTSTANNRALRTYLRTSDKRWGYTQPSLADWSTNQNYVRLDFLPTSGTVVIGQRLNGAWSTLTDNNNLTDTLATLPWSNSDTNWHTANVTLRGRNVSVTIDGVVIGSAVLPASYPTNGYLQWRADQTTVELDDLLIRSIDTTAPPTPTAASMVINGNGGATTQVEFGLGSPSDIATTYMYESLDPIPVDVNPATLTVIGQANGAAATVNAVAINQAAYQAVGVIDQSGNRSGVVAISVDTTPPSTVNDLRGR